MQKTCFLIFVFITSVSFLYAQDTLFYENFESGSAPGWSLNAAPGTGANIWFVNNVYYGGGSIPNTPNELASATGGPNSYYLHVYNQTACTAINACSASFDWGSNSTQYADMAGDVVTTGYTNVTFSFHYLNAGNLNSLGSVEYSADGGANWFNLVNYSGVPNWQIAHLTGAALDNQPTLRFRFKWMNSSFGNNPPFSVDEVVITGTPPTTINTATPGSVSYCAGTAMAVPFSVGGTFTSGNIFTAQISDASGSFITPVAIGTLTGTTSGTINATIPVSTPTGTGYRVRIVSSAPPVLGTMNGTNLGIYPLPAVTFPPFIPDHICADAPWLTLNTGTPSGGTYSGSGVILGSFNPGSANPGLDTIVYTYTDPGNNCTNRDTATITVDPCTGVSEKRQLPELQIYPNPSNGLITLEAGSELNRSKEFSVLNIIGETVHYDMIDPQSGKAEMNLKSGIYFIRLNNGKEKPVKVVIL